MYNSKTLYLGGFANAEKKINTNQLQQYFPLFLKFFKNDENSNTKINCIFFLTGLFLSPFSCLYQRYKTRRLSAGYIQL